MLPPIFFTLTGTYTSGFELPIATRVLSITSTGYVEGDGVSAGNSSSGLAIYNDGRVIGAGAGIDLTGLSATITNGDSAHTNASIVGGFDGIYASYAKVSNFGTIKVLHSDYYPAGAVFAETGGVVTNGSGGDTTALIDGGGLGFNFGVELLTKGSVTNFGTIRGVLGVELGAGTVVNFGAIAAADTSTNSGDIRRSVGVGIGGVGEVTNGSQINTAALIEGARGVIISGPGSVFNYGSIVGTYVGSYLPANGAGGYAGVRLEDGGLVDNGAPTSTAAEISGGGYGVWAQVVSGTVHNYGKILAQDPLGCGVRLDEGGLVTNGKTAVIQGGGTGLEAAFYTDVDNHGTIIGTTDCGALFESGGVSDGGGVLVNEKGALVEGKIGVALLDQVEGHNYGMVRGTGGPGVTLSEFSNLYNGAGALVEGVSGVALSTYSRFTNYGTVVGTGGVAVSMTDATSILVVGAGGVFEGAVDGDGGELRLQSGGGLISGLSGGNLTVSEGATSTVFSKFDTVTLGQAGDGIDPPPSYTLKSAGTVSVGDKLTNDGTLIVDATLTVAGTLLDQRTLSGSGILAIAETGYFTLFGGPPTLTIARVTERGDVMIEEGCDVTYAGAWSQTTGTLTAGNGTIGQGSVTFTGAGDSFAGTLAGEVTFASGTQALKAATLASGTLTIAAGDKTTAAGAITLGAQSAFDITGGTLVVAGTGASFTGGHIALSDASRVIGAVSTSTFTNTGALISGAGQLGGGRMTLVNAAGGVIDANVVNATLIIDTGANTITNAGKILSSGTGALAIDSVVDNTGQIDVTGGVLTASQAITGAGKVEINGGTADFASSFSEKVSFGATGVLELAKSQSYAGTISGFSKTGTTSLDLLDIAFGAKTKATYSGTTTSGVLTVTDGTHTAKIAFAGNYTGTTFGAASDGHGGTTLVDNTQGSMSHAFVAAMASFGGSAAGEAAMPGAPWRAPPAALLAPSHFQ